MEDLRLPLPPCGAEEVQRANWATGCLLTVRQRLAGGGSRGNAVGAVHALVLGSRPTGLRCALWVPGELVDPVRRERRIGALQPTRATVGQAAPELPQSEARGLNVETCCVCPSETRRGRACQGPAANWARHGSWARW